MAQPMERDSAESDRRVLLARASALVDYFAGILASPDAAPKADPLAGQLATPPRQAGVLVPLYARRDAPHLLFTRRSPALANHSGQISFPGGGRDLDDASLVATALREAHEELGIAPESVRVLGMLAPVFTVVSNYLITPVVGWLGDGLPPLLPSPEEVAAVIEAPLAALVDPAIFHTEEWTRGGQPHTVYFYDLGPHRIWGATARILHDLLETLPA